MKEIPADKTENILIRGTNWIGDVVMTLPAIAAVRKTFPRSKITVLAKPWVAELFRICPDVDETILFQSPGIHDGIAGKFRLARKLKSKGFGMAILLQNAIEAAIIARLAGIPIRGGYNSDGRGMLLTHPVPRTKEIRAVHQVDYYLEMVKALGFKPAGRKVNLIPTDEYSAISEEILSQYHIGKEEVVVGVAPGAAYGPAKRWFPERFAAVADRLIEDFSTPVILFGSADDRDSTDRVQQNSKNALINLAGKTNLKGAISLIARCSLFISNDSGLMHVAGALGIPTIAIFGSTNPVTTSPVGEKSIVISKGVPCSPCLKKECPTDFRCMDLIGVDEIYDVARDIFKK
ncbi:MAG: lipopolysaccharide heptosyltransferase II [Proteobacteria bacterium]|nr:lipopolysaccharide heptosyltransferase II [Pseudomonadota bacterium]